MLVPGRVFVTALAIGHTAFAVSHVTFDTVAKADAPELKTSFGRILGENVATFGELCERYAGIPFAEKPLGDLRFENPVPWSASYPGGALEALKYQDTCPLGEGPVFRGSEDCLYLNIFKPANHSSKSLPVMIWIHGGSFESGNSAWPLPRLDNAFDGCNLAVAHKVIIVSISYRLGPWGFLVTQNDVNDSVDGNIGLADQREAMHWVKNQAALLGGDASRITIFGESAGAMSVQLHAISPLSAGLFQAGISQSGFPYASSPSNGLRTTQSLAAQLGCSPGKGSAIKQCLKGFTTKQIFAKANDNAATVFQLNATRWFPVVDGNTFAEHPVALMLKGRFNPNITMIVGTNTDEANFFILPPIGKFSEMSRASYETFVQQTLIEFWGFSDAQVKLVLSAYPGSDDKDNRATASSFTTDWSFLCGSRLFANNHPSTYVYRFDHRPAWVPQYLGVPHSLDIPYTFGHLPRKYNTTKEAALSKEIQGAWTRLASFGTPSGLPMLWPTWDAKTMRDVRFYVDESEQRFSEVEDFYRSRQCNLWSELWHQIYNCTPDTPKLDMVV